ncbi:hypothetical protein BJ170DRAFT_375533 [Xylariales sp. AK1849]|nr:hypothetical protein BJ170DRAFT_375533 [Xylariales sp. AK1849]
MADSFAVGRLQAALGQVTNEVTVAAANINFDFTLVKMEAPPEYQALGPVLSTRSKQNAESGPSHVLANRLSALFEDVCPQTPNLIKAYGSRASEISADVPVNRSKVNSSWIFSEFTGLDATSLWAAATSSKSALPIHLLACMLARMWTDAEATSLWVEIVAERRREISTKFERGEPVNFSVAAAATQQEITREQLASWDASARAWLRVADIAKNRLQKQLLLIVKNIELPVNAEISPYGSVIHAWVSALETIEGLVSGRPHVVTDGSVLVALSAWHLYPDILVFGGKSCNKEINMKDNLVKPGGVLSLGISDNGRKGTSRGIYWSLSLAHHRYYGRPIQKTGTLGDEQGRITFEELEQVILGAALGHWLVEMSETNTALKYLLMLISSLGDITAPQHQWIHVMQESIVHYFSGKPEDSRLLSLGVRRRRVMLDASVEGNMFGDRESTFQSSDDEDVTELASESSLDDDSDSGHEGHPNNAGSALDDNDELLKVGEAVNKSDNGHESDDEEEADTYDINDELRDDHDEQLTNSGRPLDDDNKLLGVGDDFNNSGDGLDSGDEEARALDIDNNTEDSHEPRGESEEVDQNNLAEQSRSSASNAKRGLPADDLKNDIGQTSDHDHLGAFQSTTRKIDHAFFGLNNLSVVLSLMGNPIDRIMLLRLLAGRVKGLDNAACLIAYYTLDGQLQFATVFPSNGPVIFGVPQRIHGGIPDRNCRTLHYRWVSNAKDQTPLPFEIVGGKERSWIRDGIFLCSDNAIPGTPKYKFLYGDPESAAVYAISNLTFLGPPSLTFGDGLWCCHNKLFDAIKLLRHFDAQKGLVRAVLTTLALAKRTYSKLSQEGATISCRIFDKPFRVQSIYNAMAEFQGRRRERTSLLFECDFSLDFIGFFESGYDIFNGNHTIENLIGLSAGDSLYIPTRILEDPSSWHPRYEYTRLLGNVGKPGMVILVSPENCESRGLSDVAWRLSMPAFDGGLEDCFRNTSTHLSFTEWASPLGTRSVVGLREPGATIFEAAIQVRDAGSWVADVNIMKALSHPSLTRLERGISTMCDHTSTQPGVNSLLSAIETWDQVIDCPEGASVARAHGNSLSRLALAAVLAEHCSLQDKRVVICPQGIICWRCMEALCNTRNTIFVH